MALTVGTRIGSYEIAAQIGVGGMGEVYRATDMKLKRQVAIKVLSAAVRGDADRLARFQREAEVLAALNHPNIGAIYGLEDSDDATALVMELVEGPTLADRIAQGPLPLDEALAIAKQIAEALEAAHDQGIIHRDLKPANVKVRPDSTVKVLDFGLAKAMQPTSPVSHNLSQSPTITTPVMPFDRRSGHPEQGRGVTQAGIILGTAGYMSPEQARGQSVDKRADIWAFGCVLYEMLTGTRAFTGQDAVDVLAAVVKTDANWGRLPESTPASIKTLLQRCLRKDRRHRLGDAAAIRIEIEDALAASLAGVAPVALPQRVVLLRVAVPAAVAAAAIAFGIGAWLRSPVVPEQPLNVARLTLTLPSATELSEGPSVVISPDGTQVAYAASRGSIPQLYLRPMNGFEARAIPGTAGAFAPFFSPDGQWLAFFADGKLKKVSTTGGVVVTLADARPVIGTGTWGPNDTIVFRAPLGADLLEIPSAGGEARRLLTPDPATDPIPLAAEFLPGGQTLLLTSTRGAGTADENSIDAFTIDSGARKVLIQGGSYPRYLPTGHLVFFRSGTLMAVPFDLDRLELNGSPVPVIKDVRQPFTGIGAFSCSRSGSCAYVAGATVAQRTVTFVNRTGTRQPLPLPPKSYSQPRFSPKGDKVSFWLEQLRCDIEVYDIARGATTRITSEGDNHFPVWTPDGQRITYISRKLTVGYELFSKPANGGGVEEHVSKAPQNLGALTPLSWSPDGGALAFADRGDVWVLPLSGGREPRPFVQSKFTDTTPAFSPDGRWLAYASDESSRFEVYVQPVLTSGEKYTISTDGGTEPVWAPSGRELFFRNGDQVMVVQIGTQSAFSASRPSLLFAGPFARSVNRVNYDVSPDGERFVMLNPGEQDVPATQISVLQNWTEELKRFVPTR